MRTKPYARPETDVQSSSTYSATQETYSVLLVATERCRFAQKEIKNKRIILRWKKKNYGTRKNDRGLLKMFSGANEMAC